MKYLGDKRSNEILIERRLYFKLKEALRYLFIYLFIHVLRPYAALRL